MEDYFEMVKGITREHGDRIRTGQRLEFLEELVALQSKLINEQQEMIELLKAQLK